MVKNVFNKNLPVKKFVKIIFCGFALISAIASANPSQNFAKDIRFDYLRTLNYCKDTSKIRLASNGSVNPEVFKIVSVPVDYQNPSKGQTEIYTYMRNKFDPSKPTFVMIDGGPGASSHGLINPLPNYNLIQFDQRGTGCSPIKNEAIALDAKNYSSEKTAYDMEEIRKAYQVNLWSLWGVSYGTIPATIYGSLFQARTSAVVLEGVLFDDSVLSNDLLKPINLGMKKLSTEAKEFITKYYSGSEKLFAFYEMAMRKDNGILEVNRQIEMAAKMANQFAQSENENENRKTIELIQRKLSSLFLGDEKTPIKKKMTKNNLMEISPLVFVAINCQERPSAFDKSRRSYILSEGNFIPNKSPAVQSICEKDKIQPNDQLYSAVRYPLQIPTTYIQGDEDSATVVSGAIKHYQSVPKNKSQFLYVQHAGHLPLVMELMMTDSDLYRNVLTSALSGRLIMKSDIDLLNKQENEAENPIQWFHSKRGF